MDPSAAVAETHLSVVFLFGDRAWKLPKAVRMAFVDQSTPERRAAACEREVALNRRLAPDVYLGVLAVAVTVRSPSTSSRCAACPPTAG